VTKLGCKVIQHSTTQGMHKVHSQHAYKSIQNYNAPAADKLFQRELEPKLNGLI